MLSQRRFLMRSSLILLFLAVLGVLTSYLFWFSEGLQIDRHWVDIAMWTYFRIVAFGLLILSFTTFRRSDKRIQSLPKGLLLLNGFFPGIMLWNPEWMLTMFEKGLRQLSLISVVITIGMAFLIRRRNAFGWWILLLTLCEGALPISTAIWLAILLGFGMAM